MIFSSIENPDQFNAIALLYQLSSGTTMNLVDTPMPQMILLYFPWKQQNKGKDKK